MMLGLNTARYFNKVKTVLTGQVPDLSTLMRKLLRKIIRLIEHDPCIQCHAAILLMEDS